MWIFGNFSVTHILREFNLEESISSKNAILTVFEALNFNFDGLFSYFKGCYLPKSKFRALKTDENEILQWPKLVSRKI